MRARSFSEVLQFVPKLEAPVAGRHPKVEGKLYGGASLVTTQKYH